MSDIRGVGLDLCAIDRMREHLEDRLLDRCFTRREAAYIRSRGAQAAQSMAGIWAAKEAVLKALGTGIALPLRDVEIDHTPQGQPTVTLHGQAAAYAPDSAFLLSITHEAGMAAAMAVWMVPSQETH